MELIFKEEKHLLLVQMLRLIKITQFGAAVDIYMAENRYNSDSGHVNQWDLYNSMADYLQKCI